MDKLPPQLIWVEFNHLVPHFLKTEPNLNSSQWENSTQHYRCIFLIKVNQVQTISKLKLSGHGNAYGKTSWQLQGFCPFLVTARWFSRVRHSSLSPAVDVSLPDLAVSLRPFWLDRHVARAAEPRRTTGSRHSGHVAYITVWRLGRQVIWAPWISARTLHKKTREDKNNTFKVVIVMSYLTKITCCLICAVLLTSPTILSLFKYFVVFHTVLVKKRHLTNFRQIERLIQIHYLTNWEVRALLWV